MNGLIVSDDTDSKIEIIQQNPGPYGPSRETFKLKHSNGKWKIDNTKILGWLRKEGPIIIFLRFEIVIVPSK